MSECVCVGGGGGGGVYQNEHKLVKLVKNRALQLR